MWKDLRHLQVEWRCCPGVRGKTLPCEVIDKPRRKFLDNLQTEQSIKLRTFRNVSYSDSHSLTDSKDFETVQS